MQNIKHLYSLLLNDALSEKVNEMVTYCRQHGVNKCSDGLVFRALIGEMELGPVLVGVVRARKERERVERREAKLQKKGSDGVKKRRRAGSDS